MGTLNGEDRQVLLYLQDARRLSQRIGALDRMMAYDVSVNIVFAIFAKALSPYPLTFSRQSRQRTFTTSG